MLKPEERLIWVRSLCIAVVVVGVLFRLFYLDGKVYWHDEVYTSMHITAHSRSELVERVFRGEEVSPAALQEFQQHDPNRSLLDSVLILGIEDAQHPPLYYSIARWWTQLFGDTVISIRSLSAIISLLSFPCLYWLCIELFGSPMVGWVAIALFAISPFQVLYAQEAREYSLWTLTAIVNSLALLRAMRSPTRLNWGLYTLSLIAALYTFLFSGLMAIGHGIYVSILSGFGITRRSISYLVALTVALIALLPWLYFIKTYAAIVTAATAWTMQGFSLDEMFQRWMLNFARLFIDFDFDLNAALTYVLILPIVVLQLYAFYYLIRRTPAKVWLFVVTLTASTFFALIIPDLLLGGQRSTVTRYLIPSYIGIYLAVAYLLAQRIRSIYTSRQFVWKLIAGLLLVVGISSCGMSASKDTWWNKVISYHNPAIASVINASDRPLVISDAFGINPGNVVSLSYLLNENTRLILLPEVGNSFTLNTLPNGTNSIFLFGLPERFRIQFEQKFQVKLTNPIGDLWQLKIAEKS
jgi:uncharacterized membrane protein